VELLTKLPFALFDPNSSIPAQALQRLELEYKVKDEFELEDLLTLAS
jgi:hypothetical protein